MLIKRCKIGGAVLATTLAVTLATTLAAAGMARADPTLAGCRTPDGLCASVNANTSAPPANAAVRIALLLPLRSARLAGAAEAVRAGFMAAVERDGSGFKVDLVSTGDTSADALDAYGRAVAGADVVVGPMLRSAVGALAGSRPAAVRPTIALTAPESAAEAQLAQLPPWLLVAALSVELEARQAAEWAAREHPHGRALVLTGGAAWAQRAAAAFEARWTELGHTSQRFTLPATLPAGGRMAALDDLKTRQDIDPPELFFAALDLAELRAVRSVAGSTVPCYGGSSINPGRAPGSAPELDGVRIVDLPFVVLPDHPAVMVFPRPLHPLNPDQALDMERLYALGIDAFYLARALVREPGARLAIDGVSGRLDLVRDANPGGLRLRRREATVVYHDGRYEAVEEPVDNVVDEAR